MEERLGRLASEGSDIEKLRNFFKEVRTSHLGTRKEIGDLIKQFL
jgi:hypothetical protein